MVSGVMCLLLGEYPDLSWRDVQHIIVESAQPIDTESETWATNGAGRNFSHTYGFGRIDAEKMLQVASQWEELPQLVFVDSGAISIGETKHEASYKIEVVTSIVCEHISLYIDVSGVSRGSLTVTLTSPSGMVSNLVVKSSDYHTGMQWLLSSNAHWGEDSKGKWTIEFGNSSGQYMTVNGYQMLIDGHYA